MGNATKKVSLNRRESMAPNVKVKTNNSVLPITTTYLPIPNKNKG